jgi:hypothetical protein
LTRSLCCPSVRQSNGPPAQCNEYANTVRDLLLRFSGEIFSYGRLGDGFDNIGDVLTVSPVLMERYMVPPKDRNLGAFYRKSLCIRERKVRRSIAAPSRPIMRRIRGDYTIRIGLPGRRAKDLLRLAWLLDGLKLLQTKSVATKPSGLVYFDPYSEEEMRLYLPRRPRLPCRLYRRRFCPLTDKDATTAGQQVPGFDSVHPPKP